MSESNRYRRGRELAGLSIAQAARLLEISATRLAEMEAARDASLAQRMSDVYGASVAWLRGAEPNVPPTVLELLRDDRLAFCDRDALLELLGSMYSAKGVK